MLTAGSRIILMIALAGYFLFMAALTLVTGYPMGIRRKPSRTDQPVAFRLWFSLMLAMGILELVMVAIIVVSRP